MIKTLPSFESCMYSPVYEVLEWKDGKRLDTKDTGLCIHCDDEHLLDTRKYVATSFSTSTLNQDTLTIEIASPQTHPHLFR